MQITIPTNIGANPLTVSVNMVTYTVSPGTTVTVPDAVGTEILRMIAARTTKTPAIDLPFGDAGQQTEIGALATRLTAVEAAVQVKELPDLPTTDGTYSMQLVMDDGVGTLTWEAVEAASTEPAGT